MVNFGYKCEHCVSFKLPSKLAKAPLHNIRAGFPNEIVIIDFIGSLPIIELGNRYVLGMVDIYVEWCAAISIEEVDALTISRTILKDWVTRWRAHL